VSLAPASKLRQVLPVVISGGRPAVRQRPTAKLLNELCGVTSDPVWVVMEGDAAGYEADGHEVITYPRAWAEEYASAHWTALRPPEPGGFLGAFAGREYACRIAEERGYWAVLQLDDNITDVAAFRRYIAGWAVAGRNGGLGMFADVLAAVTLSTNGRMVGACLTAAHPPAKFKVARTGFPYSLFLERLGPGRENWFGPFEDDITHAYQYGSSAESGTPLVIPPLVYHKENASKTGMRGRYDSERAVPLQRMFPETAKVAIRKRHSNGEGTSRVFHSMSAAAIRTPMVITDRDAYSKVAAYLTSLGLEFSEQQRQEVRAKVDRRAARYR
jgi:hypothetical protein